WDDSTSTCTMQNGASFKFDDLWNIIKEYEPSEVIAITSNLTDFIRLCDSLPNAQWNSSAYKCTFNSQEYQTYYALKTAVKDIVKQSCIASQNAWNDSTDTCTGNNYSYSFNEVLSAIMTGQTKFGNFTVTTDLGVIKTGTSQPVPAQPQLSIISPSEIQAGQILVGSSTNVLKLKFQAPLDADITVSSIKITTQGSAPVSDLQSFKLIEGANVIGSSTNIGIETLIATPSFTILKDASRELALNVIAKPNAVKDNMYLFRIQANTDISASTQNIFLNPAPLSSQLFTIATAGVTPPPPPPPTTPTVSLTASPATSQTAGQSITFTMTINNPSGGLYNYYLDLGDGKTVKTLPGSTSTTATFDNNSYNEAKTYTVKGTVTMVINNVATIITAPDLNYTITAVAPPPPPPPPPSPEITNLQNQLTLMQQQFANSQTAQSTAQIAALNKQISDLIALAAAKDAADAAKTKASEEKGKKPKEKAKTPIETVEMWGAGPVPTPTYIPPVPQPMPTYIPPAPGAGAQMYPMYASAPSLGYSQKLVKAPDKSNTGPEVLLYFIAVGAANAAWWIRRKIKK
ncbi:hypothetical protein HZC21_00410, partial [Candidatus Peregrinibacteria bacterium]|nr:hypothetical protein [Candidatus Peregrinibacteria bacterium]